MSTERPSMCLGEHSILLVVDVQSRLTVAMREDDRARVFRTIGILAQAAELLGVPTFLTEQYSKGLGPTEPSVSCHLTAARRFEKTSFSCCGAQKFPDELLATGRRQVVIAGMEAHVCVLQTALDLRSAGFEVFVAEDGVCSRDPRNRHNALERLRRSGVIITNAESVVFEWMRDSRHEHFKAVSALVR